MRKSKRKTMEIKKRTGGEELPLPGRYSTNLESNFHAGEVTLRGCQK